MVAFAFVVAFVAVAASAAVVVVACVAGPGAVAFDGSSTSVDSIRLSAVDSNCLCSSVGAVAFAIAVDSSRMVVVFELDSASGD